MSTESDLQHALDFLRGLHPEITVDDPMTVAEQIFDHVMAERREHKREIENMWRNIQARDGIIARIKIASK